MGALDLDDGCSSEPGDVHESWPTEPKDRDDLLVEKLRIAKRRVVGKGLNLEKITDELNRNVPNACRITWRELAIFNWGTDVPAEINWYLRKHLHHCIERTQDRQNYMFVGKPDKRFLQRTGSVPFIWIPEYFALEPIPGRIPFAETATMDSLVCAYREKGGSQCTRVEFGDKTCKRLPLAESRSPAAPDQNGSFTIPDPPEKGKQKLLIEQQNIKTVVALLNEWRIRRIDASGARLDGPVETVTNLDLILLKHESGNPFYESLKKSGRESSGSRLPSPAIRPLKRHPLGAKGKQELDAVAKTIRDMNAMRKLERVIIRGYTDRGAVRTKDEREAFTDERARWVFDTLVGHYGLPLIDEADTAGAPDVAADLRQTVLADLIPTQIVGCGVGDAPRGKQSPQYEVVIFDFEEKDAVAQEEHVDELQEQQRWSFFSRGEGDDRQTVLHSQLRDGIAWTEAQVEACRNDARAYVWLLGAVTAEGHADKLEALNEAILRWEAKGSGVLVKKFRTGVLEAPTSSYRKSYVTEKASEQYEVEASTGTWMPFMKRGEAYPNNERELVSYTAITASTDDLKLVQIYSSDTYPLAQRIHFV